MTSQPAKSAAGRFRAVVARITIRRIFGNVVLAATLLARAVVADAGTIGFQIQTSVTTGPGVSVEVTLTHTGDETARTVVPSVMLRGREVAGKQLERLHPGQSHRWKIEFQKEDLPPGVYTLITRVVYSDANAYPFEVTAATPFNVAMDPLPRVTGRLLLPSIQGKSSTTATLTLSFPETRKGPFKIELVLPAGLHAPKTKFTITPDGTRSSTTSLRLSNRSLLAGTRINLFALVTNQGTPPQTDLIQGTLRIIEKKKSLTTGFFVKLALGAGLSFALLELIWALRKLKK